MAQMGGAVMAKYVLVFWKICSWKSFSNGIVFETGRQQLETRCAKESLKTLLIDTLWQGTIIGQLARKVLWVCLLVVCRVGEHQHRWHIDVHDVKISTHVYIKCEV